MKASHSNKIHFAIVGCGQISKHVPYLFENLLRSDVNANILNSNLSSGSQIILEKDINDNFCFFEKSTDYQKLDLNHFKAVFLAVPDAQILETYTNLKNLFLASTVFYHLSGALYFPEIIGLHPLMTFTKNDHKISYDLVPLFTDNEAFYVRYAKLNNNLKYISPALKSKYHAMAVMLGNFSQYYLQIVKDHFPEDLCFKDYEMLTEFSVKNIFSENSRSLLTGPLVRGDFQTLQKHKEVLKSEKSKVLDIYIKMEDLFHREFKNL
jgi:predicted short-subunit dehydrogenase-like oxidoreductase (DUF2520 family)